jgi:hypothetical protein
VLVLCASAALGAPSQQIAVAERWAALADTLRILQRSNISKEDMGDVGKTSTIHGPGLRSMSGAVEAGVGVSARRERLVNAPWKNEEAR